MGDHLLFFLVNLSVEYKKTMVFIAKKPAVPPQHLKGQVIASGNVLYESLQRPDGSYFWHLLAPNEAIQEDSVHMINSDATGDALRLIFKEMRENPHYRYSPLDYDSFYENRSRYPMLWNGFLKLYRASVGR